MRKTHLGWQATECDGVFPESAMVGDVTVGLLRGRIDFLSNRPSLGQDVP